MSGSGPATGKPTAGAEPHHVPHGYTHPKERHHWYWYGGFVAAAFVIVMISWIYWQYDHGAAPLCQGEVESAKASPGGDYQLEVVRVSCLGMAERQLITLRETQGGSHTVGSFDGEAQLRFFWLSEDEAVVRRNGGRMWAFQPHKGGVHFKYR